MDIQERINLIKKGTEEVLVEKDLRYLIENDIPLNHYIGFEISGKVHLGTGFVCMAKIKDFIDAGVNCSIFLADWHSWINDKLGGDMDKIQEFSVGYFKEGLKAGLICVGADPNKVKFTLGSELYHNNDEYWETVIDVCKNTTLSRMQRSITILGRKQGENIDFAKLIYPAMQVADIFIQNINLAHAGYDQRKAHVIARDVALKMSKNNLLDKKGNKIKPICVHNHLILGLQKPSIWPVENNQKLQELWSQMKMSKSIPDSAVFIHDTPDEIERKINSAFCPEGNILFNPILDWVKNLIFREQDAHFHIERPSKFGGNIEFYSYLKLEETYQNKEIHPLDLKKSVAREIIKLLEPARRHFEKPKIKRMREELEELIITR